MDNDKYRIFPPLSNEKFEALKSNIKAKGILIPIEVDEHGNILDGFERDRAAKALRLPWVPFIVRRGLTEKQKIEHTLNINLTRRQLTKKDLRTLAMQLRAKGRPQDSIASILGVSQKTISNWLAEFSNFTEPIVGKDGKSYPPKKRMQPKKEMQVQEQKKQAAINELLGVIRERACDIKERSVNFVLPFFRRLYKILLRAKALLLRERSVLCGHGKET